MIVEPYDFSSPFNSRKRHFIPSALSNENQIEVRQVNGHGKSLTIKSRTPTRVSGISTMTNFRAEQALVARVNRRLNKGSKPSKRPDRSATRGESAS
jgi:hypothetical protein